MTVESALRVSGDVLATTAAAIAAALAPVFPGAKVEVSAEVVIERDDIGIAVYSDRDAPEGGRDFLVGGHLWLDRDDARALLDRMSAALARANIAHSLELSRKGALDVTAEFNDERYALVLEARRRARRTPPP